MTNKAYIVANKQQEREVLDKLEREGMTWSVINEKPTENKPSNWFKISIFPYIIFVEKNTVTWNFISRLEDEEIVYDGRKEEKMSDKYVVSKEFMYELKEWRKNKNLINELIWYTDIKSIPEVVKEWWAEDFVDKTKTNNRLIAIIRWVNGEDVFEVEKWVVRSKETDSVGSHLYVNLSKGIAIPDITTCFGLENATRFDTKEEAESWANAHQEVIEIEVEE